MWIVTSYLVLIAAFSVDALNDSAVYTPLQFAGFTSFGPYYNYVKWNENFSNPHSAEYIKYFYLICYWSRSLLKSLSTSSSCPYVYFWNNTGDVQADLILSMDLDESRKITNSNNLTKVKLEFKEKSRQKFGFTEIDGVVGYLFAVFSILNTDPYVIHAAMKVFITGSYNTSWEEDLTHYDSGLYTETSENLCKEIIRRMSNWSLSDRCHSVVFWRSNTKTQADIAISISEEILKQTGITDPLMYQGHLYQQLKTPKRGDKFDLVMIKVVFFTTEHLPEPTEPTAHLTTTTKPTPTPTSTAKPTTTTATTTTTTTITTGTETSTPATTTTTTAKPTTAKPTTTTATTTTTTTRVEISTPATTTTTTAKPTTATTTSALNKTSTPVTSPLTPVTPVSTTTTATTGTTAQASCLLTNSVYTMAFTTMLVHISSYLIQLF